MVILMAEKSYQQNGLRLAMDEACIPYEIRVSDSGTYLVVDGVPLDEKRALKWIESKKG